MVFLLSCRRICRLFKSSFVFDVPCTVELCPVDQADHRHYEINRPLGQVYRVKVGDIHAHRYHVGHDPPYILFSVPEQFQNGSDDSYTQGKGVEPGHFSPDPDQNAVIDDPGNQDNNSAEQVLEHGQPFGLGLLGQLPVSVPGPVIPGDKIHGNVEKDLQSRRSPDMPVDQVNGIDYGIDRGKKKVADVGFGGKEDADHSADRTNEVDDSEPGRVSVRRPCRKSQYHGPGRNEDHDGSHQVLVPFQFLKALFYIVHASRSSLAVIFRIIVPLIG